MNKRKKKNINKLIKDYYRCSDKDERNNILVQKIIPQISNTTEKKEVINLCNRQLKIFEIKDYIGIFIPITLLPLLFDLSLRIIYKLIPSVQWGTVERFREYISIFLFSVAILLLIIDFLLTIFNKNYDNNYNIGIFNYDLYSMRIQIIINTLSLDVHHDNTNSSFCKNCKHYHGESYNGNQLICGMYPYGKENATDKEEEKIVTQLEDIKNGGFVPEDWGWKRVDGEPFVGKININGEKDLLTSLFGALIANEPHYVQCCFLFCYYRSAYIPVLLLTFSYFFYFLKLKSNFF